MTPPFKTCRICPNDDLRAQLEQRERQFEFMQRKIKELSKTAAHAERERDNWREAHQAVTNDLRVASVEVERLTILTANTRMD